MAYQNIDDFNFRRVYATYGRNIMDLTIASDEREHDTEVMFSDAIIAFNDGERLPISIDFNSSGSTNLTHLEYGYYNEENVIISENHGPLPSCITATTLCDIGLTGIDNGLVGKMSGETMLITNGLLDDSMKFHRTMFDKRMKFHQVTGHTSAPNIRFSGNSGNTIYEIETRTGTTEGVYHELYGGFYQGFFKLFGYDHEVMPERPELGWTMEILLRPRLINDRPLSGNSMTLNDHYPENRNTFFYIGSRAENKFYHFADKSGGTPEMRVTDELVDLFTCECSGDTCHSLYQEREVDNVTTITPCNATISTVERPQKDPLMDSMSNALSLRLCGDPSNPSIGVKTLTLTGGCSHVEDCEDEISERVSGYSITEVCTPNGIYDVCSDPMEGERWIMVDVTFKRNRRLIGCDAWANGGLGTITVEKYERGTDMPSTIGNDPPERSVITELNGKWISEEEDRRGTLSIFVNGFLFHTIEDFEEVIPRQLNEIKEKQIGVPFNISIGGGTQGLLESLTFISPELTMGPYQQDPEVMSDLILSGSSFSGETNNMLIEGNFAGNFEGGISQFRFYSEPLSSAQIQHNFRLLKDKFDLFDYFCDNC